VKTLSEIVAEQIRTRREAIGMKQGELAEQLGMDTQNTVSNWERGKFCPSLIYMCDLADVFKCTVDELLGRK
jgi:transcriptional regulator with XRE-family HTH domain